MVYWNIAAQPGEWRTRQGGQLGKSSSTSDIQFKQLLSSLKPLVASPSTVFYANLILCYGS